MEGGGVTSIVITKRLNIRRVLKPLYDQGDVGPGLQKGW